MAGVTPLNTWDSPALALISPYNFARGIGKRPFLMNMGTTDRYYDVAEVETVFGMIEGAPKKLSYYESGHRLPEAYVTASVDWFRQNLK